MGKKSSISIRSARHVEIYRRSHAYAAFPDVADLGRGRVGLVFRHARRRSFVTHLDPSSRVFFLEVGRRGRPGRPRCLCRLGGCQDPSLGRLRDGSLVVTFFRWEVVCLDPSGRPAAGRRFPRGRFVLRGSRRAATNRGVHLLRSTDEGRTWSLRVPGSFGYYSGAGTSDAVVENGRGELLLPCYGVRRPGESSEAFVAFLSPSGAPTGRRSVVMRDPQGETGFFEPALCAAGGGEILCLCRTHAKGRLAFSRSSDGGRRWSAPRLLPLRGYPAHMLPLGEGRVLATYGYRWESPGVRGALLSRRRSAWAASAPFVIRANGRSADVGYPSTVRLPDGRFLTVYYFHDRGGGGCLQGTLYHLLDRRGSRFL